MASEGGRPVYVDASTIIPLTGATSVLGSRLNSDFGQVLATRSDLASESKQVTFSLGGFTSKGAVLNFSYTLGKTTDEGATGMGGGGAFGGFGGGGGGGGGFGSPTTAGNPNVREWAVSNFDRRHTFVGTVTYPFSQAIEVTAFGRLSSGSPFTPLVGSDINGDGARNDRAFLFNPSTAADPTVAAGMQRLLDNSSDAVRVVHQQPDGDGGRPQLVPRAVAAVARPAAQLAPELPRPQPSPGDLGADGERVRRAGPAAPQLGQPERMGAVPQHRQHAAVRARLRPEHEFLQVRSERALRLQPRGAERDHRAVPARGAGALHRRA